MSTAVHVYDISATDVVALAVAAEQGGLDRLWLGEHPMVPVDFRSQHPGSERQVDHNDRPVIDLASRLADPMAALAAAARETSNLQLATGIFLLPLRHPILSARAGATLAELSGDRFTMGVAGGWLREEFAALGVPFERRYQILEEAIAVLRAAWAGGPFEYHGQVFDFGPCQVTEVPASIDVVLGGNGPRALRRAALLGDGWLSSGALDPDHLRASRDLILRTREEAGLEGPFTFHCRISAPSRDELKAYLDLGFDEVVIIADDLWSPTGSLEERQRIFIERAHRLLDASP